MIIFANRGNELICVNLSDFNALRVRANWNGYVLTAESCYSPITLRGYGCGFNAFQRAKEDFVFINQAYADGQYAVDLHAGISYPQANDFLDATQNYKWLMPDAFNQIYDKEDELTPEQKQAQWHEAEKRFSEHRV